MRVIIAILFIASSCSVDPPMIEERQLDDTVIPVDEKIYDTIPVLIPVDSTKDNL